MKSLGQICYERYACESGYRGYNVDLLPAWGEQQENIKAAWESAAKAVELELNAQRVASYKKASAVSKQRRIVRGRMI